MESTAKELLEQAYGRLLTEAEFQAMANNLSTVFRLLSEAKKLKEKNQHEN